MTIIKLEELDFYAHHGFYAEEQKIGNKYTVSVELGLENVNFSDDDLDQTINYEEVYAIISTLMSIPTKLLETLASSINKELLKQFGQLLFVQTSVSKNNPPIKGICKKATVTIREEK